MEAVGNLLLQLVNAILGFFLWLYNLILAPIVNLLLNYIPRQFLIGGIILVIMIAILLRVGLKEK